MAKKKKYRKRGSIIKVRTRRNPTNGQFIKVPCHQKIGRGKCKK